MSSQRVPHWDLALVLTALRGPPFEPMASCEPKYLTLKTVFLVAFATAARRSELHALSKDFSRDMRWTYVKLKTVDGFLAKNHTPTVGALAFRCFTIKSIAAFIDSPGLEDEKAPCRLGAPIRG